MKRGDKTDQLPRFEDATAARRRARPVEALRAADVARRHVYVDARAAEEGQPGLDRVLNWE